MLHEKLTADLNDTIYDELGNFGDIVELSRKQILQGFVRTKQKKKIPKPPPLNPLPERMPSFPVPFEKSSRKRWEEYHTEQKLLLPVSQSEQVMEKLSLKL